MVLTAQTRAWWVAFCVLVGTVGSAGGYAWRLQRTRKRELEALRARIARDLHDEIGSNLSSIRLISEMACRKGVGESDADRALSEIMAVAAESTEALRDIVLLFREGEVLRKPAILEQIRRCAGSLLSGMQWEIESCGGAEEKGLPFADGRELILLLREGLHNCARHSEASTVRILISWRAKELEVTVRDNGCGFDAEDAAKGGGLANMRERANALGGCLEVVSAAGEGTTVRVTVPLR